MKICLIPLPIVQCVPLRKECESLHTEQDLQMPNKPYYHITLNPGKEKTGKEPRDKNETSQ